MRVGPAQHTTAAVPSVDEPTAARTDTGFANALASALEVDPSSKYYRYVVAPRHPERELSAVAAAPPDDPITHEAPDAAASPSADADTSAFSTPADVVETTPPAPPDRPAAMRATVGTFSGSSPSHGAAAQPGALGGGHAPELSASTYRLFANAFHERGDAFLEQYFLDRVPLAREAGVPYVRGSGVLSANGRWDYNAGAARYEETGTFDPTSGQGVHAFIPWGDPSSGGCAGLVETAASPGSGANDGSTSNAAPSQQSEKSVRV